MSGGLDPNATYYAVKKPGNGDVVTPDAGTLAEARTYAAGCDGEVVAWIDDYTLMPVSVDFGEPAGPVKANEIFWALNYYASTYDADSPAYQNTLRLIDRLRQHGTACDCVPLDPVLVYGVLHHTSNSFSEAVNEDHMSMYADAIIERCGVKAPKFDGPLSHAWVREVLYDAMQLRGPWVKVDSPLLDVLADAIVTRCIEPQTNNEKSTTT